MKPILKDPLTISIRSLFCIQVALVLEVRSISGGGNRFGVMGFCKCRVNSLTKLGNITFYVLSAIPSIRTSSSYLYFVV